MPAFLGIPLIGWIQIVIGTGLVLFFATKYFMRGKRTRIGEYIIRGAHVIVGDGTELFDQNV